MKRERLEELVRSTNEAVGRVNGEFVSEYSASAIRAALLAVERETVERVSGKLKERDELADQNIKDFAEQEKVSVTENEYLLGRGDEAHGAYIAIRSLLTEE